MNLIPKVNDETPRYCQNLRNEESNNKNLESSEEKQEKKKESENSGLEAIKSKFRKRNRGGDTDIFSIYVFAKKLSLIWFSLISN